MVFATLEEVFPDPLTFLHKSLESFYLLLGWDRFTDLHQLVKEIKDQRLKVGGDKSLIKLGLLYICYSEYSKGR